MKSLSIIFLRTALIVISLAVLGLCGVLLPILWPEIGEEFPKYSYAVRGVFLAVYTTAIPFYIGMYKAWQLLNYVRQGIAFSEKSVKALKTISYSALAVGFIYILAMPFFYVWAERDDAPGLMVVNMMLAGAPIVVGVFAGVLQRLIAEAVDIKSENELTV